MGTPTRTDFQGGIHSSVGVAPRAGIPTPLPLRLWACRQGALRKPARVGPGWSRLVWASRSSPDSGLVWAIQPNRLAVAVGCFRVAGRSCRTHSDSQPLSVCFYAVSQPNTVPSIPQYRPQTHSRSKRVAAGKQPGRLGWTPAFPRRTLSGCTSAFGVRTFAIKIVDGDLHFVVRSRVAPLLLKTLVDR